MEEQKKSWSVAAEIRAEQKAALKDMPLKAKLTYFWEYYKIHTIITIVSLATVGSFVYNIVTNKDYSFYALVLNSYALSGEAMAEDFSKFAGLDNDRLTCIIETDTHMNINEFSPYEMAVVQRVAATVMAGDLDVIVADAYTFIYFADGEFFVDLRFVLSEALLKQHQDNLFYIDQAVITKKNEEVNLDAVINYEAPTFAQRVAEVESRGRPENMINPIPVGIFLTDTVMEGAYFENAFPVLGFIGSSGRFDEAVLYLEFIGR